MKKLRILNIVCLAIALVLEIIPYGVKMVWAGFFHETETYHSYFDLTVWGYGDMGPFLCGIFTVIIIAMLLVALFKPMHKAYIFCVCALSLAATMLSVVPVFFSSYTVLGLFITVLLGASTELTIMQYMDYSKNK